jgi:hypothetical protein
VSLKAARPSWDAREVSLPVRETGRYGTGKIDLCMGGCLLSLHILTSCVQGKGGKLYVTSVGIRLV